MRAEGPGDPRSPEGRKPVAGLPAAYWYLWAGTLVSRLGYFVVPFLSLYLVGERGFGAAGAALIVSLFGAGSVAASFAGGALADRAGRKVTMLVALFGASASVLGLGFARGYWAVAALACVAGFFTDLYRPAASAAVADLVTPEDRPRAYALVYWATNVGAAVAPVLAGLAASRGYLLLFLADAATSLAFALLVMLRVPETGLGRDSRAPSAAEPAPARPPGVLRAALSDPALLALTTLSFGFALLFFQGYVTLPLDMRAEGLSEAQYGAAIAVNGALIVALGLPASRVLGTLPRFGVLAAASVLMGAGFGLNALVETAPLYAVAVAVWTLGELSANPVASAAVADLAPARLRGAYQGVYGSSWSLASLAGPALGGLVLSRFGPGVLWSGCLMLGVAVAAGYLALGRRTRRRSTRSA